MPSASTNVSMTDFTHCRSDEYLAGLIDAQLVILPMRKNVLRVGLQNKDSRISREITQRFPCTKETIIRDPKKETCCMLYVGDAARDILEFARDKCIAKSDMAKAALDCLDGKTTDIPEPTDVPEDCPDVDVQWVSGFFDAKCDMDLDTETKKARVKLVVPKTQAALIAKIQKTAGGKVKKGSPCRLVFDSKTAIRGFLEACGDHIRVKAEEVSKAKDILGFEQRA